MLPRVHRATVHAAVWLTTVCLIAACSSSDPLGAEIRSPKSIVVGSGDFPESEIVAEIYAQALQANGFETGRRMGIGSRETYIPALKDHSIDLVPEYIGNLLLYFAPDSTATMLDAVELELYKKLPGDLSILTPSPASDTDTVTVTGGTASAWNLKTIADLAAALAGREIRGALGVREPPVRPARVCGRSTDSTSARATSSPSTTAAVR